MSGNDVIVLNSQRRHIGGMFVAAARRHKITSACKPLSVAFKAYTSRNTRSANTLGTRNVRFSRKYTSSMAACCGSDASSSNV